MEMVFANYIKTLGEKSSISYALSLGYFGLFHRKAERNSVYDEKYQDIFDVYNYDIIKFKPIKRYNSYAFDCRLSTNYHYRLNKNLRLYNGLSYYYAQNGMTLHHGLYGNMGIVMFINEPREYFMPPKFT